MPHTPGPWEAERGRDDESHVIRMASAIECRYAYQGHHRLTYDHALREDDPDFGEAEANAILIAAAPKLLEAVRKARAWIAEHPYAAAHTDVLDELRAVIDLADPLH